MSDTSNTTIDLIDQIAGIREDIRILSIFLRGALSVLEADGPDTYAAVKEHGDERTRSCYSALTASLYYVSERLEDIVWPEAM